MVTAFSAGSIAATRSRIQSTPARDVVGLPAAAGRERKHARPHERPERLVVVIFRGLDDRDAEPRIGPPEPGSHGDAAGAAAEDRAQEHDEAGIGAPEGGSNRRMCEYIAILRYVNRDGESAPSWASIQTGPPRYSPASVDEISSTPVRHAAAAADSRPLAGRGIWYTLLSWTSTNFPEPFRRARGR